MWQAIRCVWLAAWIGGTVVSQMVPQLPWAARVEATAGGGFAALGTTPSSRMPLAAALRVRHRDRRQERLRVGMIRRGEHLLRPVRSRAPAPGT